MGNQTATMNCPVHKDEKIKYVCTEKNCIEPLCDLCSKLHRAQHEKLGFSPSLVPVSQIVRQHEQYEKLNKQIMKEEDEIAVKDRQYIPTGYLLKKLTRQYFSKKFQENKNLRNRSKNEGNRRDNFRFSQKNINVKSQSLPPFDFSMEQQKKRTKMVKILAEYQTYHKMQNNNEIQQRVLQFFKKNLVLNEGVVGKAFSHLYQ